jgi:hypothetical protein
MPYIKDKQREELDPHIDNLIETIKRILSFKDKVDFAGVLNYCCTRIAMSFFYNGEREPVRYWKLALIRGVFATLASEFERRVVKPYEEVARKKNGDLKEYEAIQGPYRKRGRHSKMEKGAK